MDATTKAVVANRFEVQAGSALQLYVVMYCHGVLTGTSGVMVELMVGHEVGIHKPRTPS